MTAEGTQPKRKRQVLQVTPALLGRARPELIQTIIQVKTRAGVEKYQVVGWNAELGCLVAERVDGC